MDDVEQLLDSTEPILPECMAPDGAEPCTAYSRLLTAYSRLSSEGSGYRRALEYIADKDSLDDPRDVAQRTLDAYGERVSLGLAQTDPK